MARSGGMLLVLLGLVVLTACGPDGPTGDDDGSCRDVLSSHAIEWSEGPAMEGVEDPLTVVAPFGDIAYRPLGDDSPHAELFMDCELARILVLASPLLAERGVVAVSDLGIYNYRCIGGGAPPDCPNGISEHAYGKAIDVAGYTTSDGTFYSVEDDWVIDGEGEETCAAATESDKDDFLHEIVCAQAAAGLWNVALTPNYNADHRDHFHLDLSPGEDFLERRAVPGVDRGADRH